VLAPKIMAQREATQKVSEKAANISKEVREIQALLEEKRRTMSPEDFKKWRLSRAKVYLQLQQQPGPPVPLPVPSTQLQQQQQQQQQQSQNTQIVPQQSQQQQQQQDQH